MPLSSGSSSPKTSDFDLLIVIMEEICAPATSVSIYRSTWPNNPEDLNFFVIMFSQNVVPHFLR